MSYHAVFLSTRWGRGEGGLNVFNKGLAEGTAEILAAAGRCYCLVDETSGAAAGSVTVLAYEDRSSPARTAEQIRSFIAASGERHDEVEVVVIGHDIHTGQLAINCAQLLQPHYTCKSAVIRHMHYRQYAAEKGSAPGDVEVKAKKQDEITLAADAAFAVGPLLTDVSRGSGMARQVATLIPGAAKVELKATTLEAGWQVFMSGRLGADDDRIKNATLAVASLGKAYQQIRAVGGEGATPLGPRGTLRLLGADPGDPALETLRAQTGQYFTIDAQAYRDDENAVLEALRSSHFAMMPSWHEGFGLTGWEAVCAGVPLVCSRHSGLYQFLERTVWAKHPKVPKDSVVAIALAGRSSNGEIRSEDVESTAEAILTIQRNGERARTAARDLAEHLLKHYSWADCARSLVDELGWSLPSSNSWRDRQVAAARREPFVEPDNLAEDDLIKAALSIVGDGRVFVEWQTVCTALNLLSSRGKVLKGTKTLAALRDVKQITGDIEKAIAGGSLPTPLRGSGGLDLVWRLLGAASSVAQTLTEFNALIGPQLWKAIVGDSFLLREFFYYICRFTADFETDGEELLDRLRQLPADQRRDVALQVRLGRLAGKHSPFRALLDEAGILGAMPQATATADCVAQLIAREGDGVRKSDEAAHLLWLSAESALPANGPRMTLDCVREAQGRDAIQRRWRGDRRFEAASLLAGLPSSALLDTLERLARDEDESLRWACLDMCFSRALRLRLVSGPKRKTPEALRQRLGEIVDVAVSIDGGHPWLQREFLNLYLAEVSGARGATSFTLEDFPDSRRLLGPSVHSPDPSPRRRLHPEVIAACAEASKKIKRILLVLPPIQSLGLEAARAASHTTTPALGLGLIASALAEAGHDVQLADLHRYPDQVSAVLENAATFDWLGLNVVLSTVRSACDLLRQVRERARRPLIVVGGPAVNLGAWRGAAQSPDSAFWDFEVRGDGERLLAQLVDLTDHDGGWPEVGGVFPNMYSPVVAERCVDWTYGTRPKAGGEILTDWSPPVLVDRRVFRGPFGSYEPAATRRRASDDVEAHVVMSKGCDWNCTFCTERMTLSGGERRRDVNSVLNEVRQISAANRKVRLQFIDDNLLPQIAAHDDTVIQARSINWANAFIAGLSQIKTSTNPSMKWRGIFRIEDFLRYEKLIPDFITRLKGSGCQMLAFGIEHGNEARRKKLKGSRTLTNDEIKQLMADLRAAGIDTKGYFILGGHKESEALGRETIEFAIDSGVTVAYFALYKEFTRTSTQLARNSVMSGESVDEFLVYDQLWLDLDDLFSGSAHLGREAMAGPRPIAGPAQRKIYGQLQRIGFRFADLVKYNDYHSDDGSAGLRSRELYYGDIQTYADLVRYAYVAFYLRPTFVSDYRRLVADGY